jgi:hypothetical protein
VTEPYEPRQLTLADELDDGLSFDEWFRALPLTPGAGATTKASKILTPAQSKFLSPIADQRREAA